MDKFPNNTTAHFTTELSEQFLATNMEMALVEMTFPSDFQPQYQIRPRNRICLQNDQGQETSYWFPIGVYNSPYQACQSIDYHNQNVAVKCNPRAGVVSFSVSDPLFNHIDDPENAIEKRVVTLSGRGQVTRRVQIISRKVAPNLTNRLSRGEREKRKYLLTFDCAVINEHMDLTSFSVGNGVMIVNFHVSNPKPSINIINVHCDIIQEQEHSGNLSKILRFVHVDNAKRIQSLTFDNPIYLRLCQERIERITISLLRDDGQVVPFRSYPSTLKLAFRKTIAL